MLNTVLGRNGLHVQPVDVSMGLATDMISEALVATPTHAPTVERTHLFECLGITRRLHCCSGGAAAERVSLVYLSTTI